MHSSDAVKTAVKVIVFILIFGLLCALFNFLIVPREAVGTWSRLMIHDMYEEDGNIDVAFLGASHVYLGIDPAVVDEKLGVDSFNLGTSAQPVSDSYFVLREMLKSNKPQTVMLEMTYTSYNLYDFSNNPTASYPFQDNFKPSVNKARHLFAAFNPDSYGDALLAFYRYRGRLVTATDKLLPDIQDKLESGYYEYNYGSGEMSGRAYAGKGYVESAKGFEEKTVNNLGNYPHPWDTNNIDEKALQYFGKIVELCEKNDIELILYTLPTTQASLVEMENYGEVDAYFQQLARRYDLPYFNFCLVKPEYFECKDVYFYDPVHMNSAGATAFSAFLSDFMNRYDHGAGIMEDYFYSSAEEMLASIDRVTNLTLEAVEEGGGLLLTAHSGQGTGAIPEYEFLYREQGQTQWTALQGYGAQNRALFEPREGAVYEFRVHARCVGSGEEYEQKAEITFPE